MITVVVVTLRHTKPLPADMGDMVAGRAWTMDHVEGAEATTVLRNFETTEKAPAAPVGAS